MTAHDVARVRGVVEIEASAPAPDQLERDLSAILGLKEPGSPGRGWLSGPRAGARAALVGAVGCGIVAAAAISLERMPPPRERTSDGPVEWPRIGAIGTPRKPLPARSSGEPGPGRGFGPGDRADRAGKAASPAISPIAATEERRRDARFGRAVAGSGQDVDEDDGARAASPTRVARPAPTRAEPDQRSADRTIPAPAERIVTGSTAQGPGAQAAPAAEASAERPSRTRAPEHADPALASAAPPRDAPAVTMRAPAAPPSAAGPANGKKNERRSDSIDAIRLLRRQ